jgi:homoserine/homoserine lactone efflux protein
MAIDTWLIYLLSVISLSLTPGPNSPLALTHGALDGHRKTLFAIGGGTLGFVALIALSTLGIGTLLQTSSAHALTALKLLGGLYLVWLGIQLWRAPPLRLESAAAHSARRGHHLFRRGLFISLGLALPLTR